MLLQSCSVGAPVDSIPRHETAASPTTTSKLVDATDAPQVSGLYVFDSNKRLTLIEELDPRAASRASLSPDGRFLTFARPPRFSRLPEGTDSSILELFNIRKRTWATKEFPGRKEIAGPVWSEGSELAAVSIGSRFFSFEPDSAQTTLLTDVGGGCISGFDTCPSFGLSRDTTQLAIGVWPGREEVFKVFIFSIRTGDVLSVDTVAVMDPVTQRPDLDLAWSPSGDQISFAGVTEESGLAVLVVDSHQGSTTIVGTGHSYGWLPNEDVLAFLRDAPHRFGLYAVDPAGGDEAPEFLVPGVSGVIAHNSQNIAYLSPDGLFVSVLRDLRTVDSREPVVIDQLDVTTVVSFAWSSDSKRLYIVVNRDGDGGMISRDSVGSNMDRTQKSPLEQR